MKSLMIMIGMVLLTSCATQISEYKESKPAFVLEEYFNGELVAYGMVQDYSDKLTRHFCVIIQADWTDKNGKIEGVIDETFYFNDGDIDTRVWRVSKNNNKNGIFYTGTAGDVVGEASGRAEGNVFQWKYDLQIPISNNDGKKEVYTFTIDDWIYLIDDERAFNKSSIDKFGLTVGQITIFFDKQQPLRTCLQHTEDKQTVLNI